MAVGLTFFGCDKKSLYPYSEVVLSPGEKVAAENENGTFSVEYVGEVKRSFEWNENSRVVKMIPRKDRFRGKVGIYNPATTYFGSPDMRLVVSEEQVHLESLQAFEEWIVTGSEYFDWVYNNEGLVAGFGRSPDRNQVSIRLHQVYISGQIPNELPGAEPGKIRLESAKGEAKGTGPINPFIEE